MCLMLRLCASSVSFDWLAFGNEIVYFYSACAFISNVPNRILTETWSKTRIGIIHWSNGFLTYGKTLFFCTSQLVCGSFYPEYPSYFLMIHSKVHSKDAQRNAPSNKTERKNKSNNSWILCLIGGAHQCSGRHLGQYISQSIGRVLIDV